MKTSLFYSDDGPETIPKPMIYTPRKTPQTTRHADSSVFNLNFIHMKTFTRFFTVCLLFAAMVLFNVEYVVAADTGWKSAASYIENSVSNEGNATSCNGQYATFNGNNDYLSFYNFGYAIPTGSTINGIEVKLVGYRGSNTTSLRVQMRYSGNNVGNSKTQALTTSPSTYYLGGATDTWGYTSSGGWTTAKINDPTTFAVRIEGTDDDNAYLDCIEVKVYYTVPCTPPTTTNPVNQTITYGANATFNVTAGGTSPYTYAWYENGTTLLSNTGVYSGATTATLTLTDPPVAMSGNTYHCVVTGQCTPVATSNNATLTVNQKQLTITGATADNKSYDGNADATISGATLNGVEAGDDVTLLATVGTFAQTNVGNSIAVTPAITIQGADIANYSLTQPNSLSADITPAALTITAWNLTKVFGQTLTSGSGYTGFTPIGLVNGESVGTVTVTYGSGAAAADPAGTYTGSVVLSAVTGGTFNPTNYNVSYVNGDIEVTALCPVVNVTKNIQYCNPQTAIADAIADATSGDEIKVAQGIYDELDAATLPKDLKFAPGASPGCVSLLGDLTLNAGDVLITDIDGVLNPCTEYDQWQVAGNVTLGGATLDLDNIYLSTYPLGSTIRIIDKSSAGAISGTFADGPFVGYPLSYTDGINLWAINYTGGTGNDVTLTAGSLPTIACPANIDEVTSSLVCGKSISYLVNGSGSPTPDYTYVFTGATTGSGNGTGTGSFFNKGTTNVTVYATNVHGQASCSFVIEVEDKTPPTITYASVPTLKECPDDVVVDAPTGFCSRTVNWTAPSVWDNCGSASLTPSHFPSWAATPTVFTVQSSPYTVTYTAQDADGNIHTCTFSVTVKDIDPPVITRLGDATVEICQGEVYTDAGATAFDLCDLNITSSIVVTNPVNTAIPGTYTVKYNVQDAEGNNATEVTRTVEVHPTPLPIFALNGNTFGTGHTEAFCDGANVEVTFNSFLNSAGTLPLTISWEVNNDPLHPLNGTSFVIDDPGSLVLFSSNTLDPGVYNIAITSMVDDNGCSFTNPETVYYFTINIIGADNVTMSNIPDISTITSTPVIIPVTMTFPDLSLQNIDPAVLTDAKISVTSGTFPAGARIFDVTYNGTSVLTTPFTFVGTETDVLLSTILGSAPTALLGHSNLNIDWKLYVDGIATPMTIPVKVEAIAYLNYATCYSVMDDDQVTVTLADATVASIADFDVCRPAAIVVNYDVTYPVIANLDASVKNDAVITILDAVGGSPRALNAGAVIKVELGTTTVANYTLINDYSTLYLSSIIANAAIPSVPTLAVQTALQGHAGTDSWKFTITGANPGVYYVDIANTAMLDVVEYDYADEDFTVNYVGANNVTIDPIVDISTATNAPVIFDATVVYGDLISQNIDASVKVDALIEIDPVLPAGATVTELLYNGFPVSLASPGAIAGVSNVLLSSIIGAPAAQLSPAHHNKTDVWTIVVTGINVANNYNITFKSIAYVDYIACHSVMAEEDFTITAADLTLSSVPDISTITYTPAIIGITATYPTITPYNADILVDARISTSVVTGFPANTEIISITANGSPNLLGGPFDVSGQNDILLSAMLTGPVQFILEDGNSYDWEIMVVSETPATTDVTIASIVYANPVASYGTIVLTSETFDLTFGDATVTAIPDMVLCHPADIVFGWDITYPLVENNGGVKVKNDSRFTFWADAALTIPASLPIGTTIEVLTPASFTRTSTLTVAAHEIYGSAIVSQLGDPTSNEFGFLLPLTRPAGTDTWLVTIKDAPAGTVFVKTENFAILDLDGSYPFDGEFVYEGQDFKVNYVGAANVAINAIANITTATNAPVIFDATVVYGDLISQNIDPSVKVDALIEIDPVLPAGATVTELLYNGFPVSLASPGAIAGVSNVLLSSIIGAPAAQLSPAHDSKTDVWTIVVTGINAANNYNITFKSIAYVDYSVCHSVMAEEDFTITMADLTLSSVPDISTITFTPAIIGITATYPAITPYNTGILVDARISTTVVGGFPANTEIISITANGSPNLLVGPFDVSGQNNILLSTMLTGPVQFILEDGNSYDWEIMVVSETPATTDVTIASIVYANPAASYGTIVLASETFDLTFGHATLTLTDAADPVCYPGTANFTFELIHPTMANVDARVLSNATIVSDKTIPAGTTIAWTQTITNVGVYSGSYTVPAPATILRMSEIWGSGMTSIYPIEQSEPITWEFDIDGLVPGVYNFVIQAAAQLADPAPNGTLFPYATMTPALSINVIGAQDVTMSDIQNISTITSTPVIIPVTVTYPDLSLQAIDPAVLTDARITTTSGYLPTGARVFDIKYNNVSVPGFTPYIFGANVNEVLLSTILASSPTTLLPHSNQIINWELYVDGITTAVAIPLKVEAIAYLNYATCYSVMDDDQVTVTFADATLAITETDITVCNTDPLKFSVAITYPAIVNVDEDVLADAIITSNVPFPIGTVINWSYNGGAMTPYTLVSATSSIILSQIVGTTPPSLQGHSGTDTWAFEITNAGIPSLHTIIIDPIALLDPAYYIYETGSVTLTVNPLPVVTAVDLQIGNTATGPFTSVSGDLAAGYVQCIDPAVPDGYHYFDINTLTNTSYPLESATFAQNAFRITSAPATFLAYWDAKDVNATYAGANPGSWQAVMWDIVNGTNPMFYIKYDGTNYSLIDGLQYQASGGTVVNPLRINGSYLEGDYTFNGTVTDINGCVSQPFDIDIKFNSVPVITCAPLTVNNDLNQCGASVDFSLFNVSATGVPTPYFTYDVAGTTITTGHFFPVGTTVVTATATNSCGAVSCNFDMIVVDNEAPRVTGTVHEDLFQYDACFIDATTPPLPSLAFNQTNALMGYGDNCPEPIVAVLTNTTVTGGHCEWTLTYTYNVMDSKGNSFTGQTYSHFGADQTAPAFAGPADCSSLNITAVDECLSAATAWDATVLETAVAGLYVDNCGTTVTATLIGTVAGGTNTDCNWIFTYTYQIEDICGNSLTCDVTRSGGDKTAPVIIVNSPLDKTLTAGATSCSAAWEWTTPLTTDNCGGLPVLTVTSDDPTINSNWVMGVTTKNTFNYGVTKVTYTSTDACLNKTEHVFYITVNDITPPVINNNAPIANITVNNDMGKCDVQYTSINWPIVNVSDNCQLASTVITRSDNMPFNYAYPVGTTTVTYTATDHVGLITTSSFTVTVVDTEPIVLAGTLPGGAQGNVCISAATPAPAEATIAALFTDNCGPIVANLLTSSVTGSDCAWTATYTYEVHNSHGQYYTNPIVIVYTGGDIEAPTVTTVAGALDVTLQCNDFSGIASALVLYPAATDNCAVTLTMHLVSDVTTPDASCPNAYVRVRTWNFEDACTNVSANFVQTITVIDDTKPVVTTGTGTLDRTLECSDLTGISDALALYPAATDNCTTTPTMHLVSDVTTPDATCANAFVQVRTWNFTDGCGNTSDDFVQTIIVEDNTPPVVTTTTGALDRTLQCDDAAGISDALALYPAATDNCTVTPTLHLLSDVTTPDLYCPSAYVQVRTWNFSDGCGNTSTVFVQTVTVIDDTDPTFTVPGPFTIYKDASCGYDADPSITGYPTDIDDNCDASPGVQYVDVVTAGSCTGEQIITRTWYVTDNCGNSSSAVQIITAEDKTDPALVGVPADVTVNCHEVPAVPTVTATDNCDPAAYVVFGAVSIQDSDPAVCGHYNYNITRTWTAYDDCGNSSTASQLITVQDVTKPVITGPADITIYKDAYCAYDADPVTVTGEATATDNCASTTNIEITYSDVLSVGSCAHETIITRTWKAEDPCGNVSTTVQIITVQDKIAPVLAGVPADATVNCHEVPAPANVTATDNCDAAPMIYFTEVSTQVADPTVCGHYNYIITRTWKAVDACSNSSTQTQVIIVKDVTKPVITGPADFTIYKDASCGYNSNPSITGVATATDNCATGYVVIDHADVTNTGSCVGEQIITRTWTAEDPCGNVSTTVQYITVKDNTDPTFSCVQTAGLYLMNNGCYYEAQGTEFDPTNLDDNCHVAYIVHDYPGTTSTATLDGAMFPLGATTVTWKIVDGCGNSTTCQITITVGGHTVSGNVNYYNSASTPMVGVIVTLDQPGTDPTFTTTSNGAYTFTNVCEGTYTVTFTVPGPLPTSDVQSTDALMVNNWASAGLTPPFTHPSIEKARFFAGDVAPIGGMDGVLSSGDALAIQNNFLYAQQAPYSFTRPWTFYNVNQFVTTQGHPYVHGTITAPSATAQNFYALLTGDFNRSYVPGAAKAGGKVILTNNNATVVESGMEIEIPITAGFNMDVAAASLILNYPADKVEVLGVSLGDNNIPVLYNATNGSLRIAWHNIVPFNLTTGETLFTLKLKATSAFVQGETATFVLSSDPAIELADYTGEVIQGALLNIGVLNATTGISSTPNDGNIALTNYPNPFVNVTTFAYTLPVDGKVTLEVYDLLGRKVADLINEHQSAGSYTFTTDTKDVRPGVYTANLRLQTEGATMTRSIKIVSHK